MIHIKQAIIVEGKYDKIKLSSIVDAVILVTNGFGIYKDEEKMQIIKYYAESTGIIILTDSDSSGFQIRNHIKGSIKNGKIINIYIPDVFGKEKRKHKPSKEGKLGVEGIQNEVIINALLNAGITFLDSRPLGSISKIDLYEDGFIGKDNSLKKRKNLLKLYNLPELLTTNSIIEIINTISSFEEYKSYVKIIDNEGDV